MQRSNIKPLIIFSAFLLFIASVVLFSWVQDQIEKAYKSNLNAIYLKAEPLLTATNRHYLVTDSIPGPLLIIEVEKDTLTENQSIISGTTLINAERYSNYKTFWKMNKMLPHIRSIAICEIFRQDKLVGRYTYMGGDGSVGTEAYSSRIIAHIFSYPDGKYIKTMTETGSPPRSLGEDNWMDKPDGVDDARNNLLFELDFHREVN